MISKEQLQSIMPKMVDFEKYTGPLNESMQKYDINNPLRIAAFIGNTAVESNQFRATRENLNYDTAGLLRVWPKKFSTVKAAQYAHQPEKIANYVYANMGGNGPESSGDGWKYRGGGPIQLTLKDNYDKAGKGIGADLVNHPELIEGPLYGCDSAAWYFKTHGCNEAADSGDFRSVIKRINSALLGLAERQAFYERAKKSLGV